MASKPNGYKKFVQKSLNRQDRHDAKRSLAAGHDEARLSGSRRQVAWLAS